MDKFDVVIIGAGPAGLGAALYAGRAGLKCCVLERLGPGGQVLSADLIENYPGFKDGVSGPEFIECIKAHAMRFGASLTQGEAVGIEPIKDGHGFFVQLASGDDIKARAVIVATGAKPRTLGVPGEKELTGKGVSYCATCDAPLFRDQVVAVVGGGDSACQEAIFLAKFARKVYLVHRRNELRAIRILRDRVFEEPKIEPVWDTVITAIEGEGVVQKALTMNVKTGKTSTLKIHGVFVFVGTTPNTGFLKGLARMDDNGFLFTNEWMETDCPGLYAAGDCRAKPLRQIITAVSDGAIAATSIQFRLT